MGQKNSEKIRSLCMMSETGREKKFPKMKKNNVAASLIIHALPIQGDVKHDKYERFAAKFDHKYLLVPFCQYD